MNHSRVYSASVFALSLASLVENIAGTIPTSYFPNYATSLGAELWFIGSFVAAFLIANAFLSQPFGSLSDRIGRRILIQAGLVADIFLGTLTGLLQNWQSLLVVRALNGVATAAVRPAAEASLVDQVPEEQRGEALGFFLTFTMIGWFLGPIFGGAIQHLSETVLGLPLSESYRIPYFVDSLLSVIALLLVTWKVKETRGEHAAKKTTKQSNSNNFRLEESVSKSIRILYLTRLTSGFSVGFIAPVGVLFLSFAYGAIPLEIGTILSVSGFVGIIFNLFAGKLSDKWGRKPVIAIGSASSRLASIALPFTSDLLLTAVVMSFRSLGINVSMPATQALIADLVPADIRGKLFGRFNAFFDAGMISGALLGPFLFDVFKSQELLITWLNDLVIKGSGVPFYLSGVIGLVSLALLLTFVKEPKK